jgi:hypothetical protein
MRSPFTPKYSGPHRRLARESFFLRWVGMVIAIAVIIALVGLIRYFVHR